MPCAPGIIASAIRIEPYETILEFSPTVYYRLNEASGTLVNSGSTASRDGTGTGLTYGATKIPTRSPKTSVSFTGASLVSVTDGVIGGSTPEFSAGIWIKTTDAVSTMHLFQQMDASNSGGGFRIYLVNGTSLRSEGKTSAGVTDWTLTVGLVDINDGIPILVGLTVTSTLVYLYVNGVYLGSTTRVGGTWSATSDIFIGGNYDGSADYTGTASDAFITSTPLTQHNWVKIYRNGMINGTAPINDPWGSPIAISGATGSQATTFTNASFDEDDVVTTTGSLAPNSTWLKYTASGNRHIKFSSTGSGNHAVQLFHQTGTLIGDLVLVDGYTALTSGTMQSYVLTDGEVYYLRVAGYILATGTATVTWLETFPPANDNFADATTISVVTSGTTSGTNADSSVETDEPANDAGEPFSTWFKFIADQTGNITIDTTGSASDTTLNIFTGSVLASLVQVAHDDDSGPGSTSLVTFGVTNGVTYHVMVSDYDGGAAYTLNWSDIT